MTDWDKDVLRFCEHLGSRGYAPRPGVSESAITAFEKRNRVHLPDDLRAYFRAANGTTGYGDDLLTSFRSLQDLRPLLKTNTVDVDCRYFVFADQLISAPDFAIDLGSAKPVVRYWQIDTLEPVSDSFLTFVRLFMEDPLKIHVHDFVLSDADS